MVELVPNRTGDKRLDIALCDTHAATLGEQADVHELAIKPLAGTVVVYSWDPDANLVKAAWVSKRPTAIIWGLQHGSFPDHQRVRPSP